MKPNTICKYFTPANVIESLQQAEAVKPIKESYNPNDAQAVADYWANAMCTRPKRGKQKVPLKVPVSIRLSPIVVDYFKAQGEGWQTRLDEVLQAYVQQQTKI
jgi:uncharacterized protein (DUF4415 family)